MTDFDWEHDDDKFIYENVRWYWDESSNELMCNSKTPEVNKNVPVATGNLGTLEFRHDIDLNEQQKFSNRFQRKYGPDDVVTLQDIKDVVLFTAPLKLLFPSTISMLHRSATDRVIRALIMYCQYFIQVSEIIRTRKAELQYKIRTPKSDKIEAIFKENLSELRMLISKEYCSFIIGSGEFSKYHHMWSSKLSRAHSLGKKEQILFETFVGIVIQIIWIALGRKSFTQIEIEVHRLLKSKIYNIAEHNQNNKNEDSWKDMKASDIVILTGQCVGTKRKINTNSPLLNELFYAKDIDYRLIGLGAFQYPCMDARLRYLENALIMPEASLRSNHISLGILGARRNRFDIMLNEITPPPPAISASCLLSRTASYRKLFSVASSAQLATRQKATTPLYNNINLPAKESMNLPSGISYVAMPRKPIDRVQQSKWMHKVQRKRKPN